MDVGFRVPPAQIQFKTFTAQLLIETSFIMLMQSQTCIAQIKLEKSAVDLIQIIDQIDFLAQKGIKTSFTDLRLYLVFLHNFVS